MEPSAPLCSHTELILELMQENQAALERCCQRLQALLGRWGLLGPPGSPQH